jgi:hypothetical protein
MFELEGGMNILFLPGVHVRGSYWPINYPYGSPTDDLRLYLLLTVL